MTLTGIIYGIEKIKGRKENYSLVTHDIIENADVCVIGSGAAGAIIASKLALAGKSVVLLEKGGYYDGQDMNQREVEMMPLLWKNGGATFTDNLRMVIAQGECLGGSTVINDAVCFKTPSIVREQWRNMGINISDNEWDKAIEEVWSAIQISKVKDYELNENNLMLKRACELKGYKSEPNDRNCVECRQCGFCHIGCHYETKQDMRVTYIHNALVSASDFRVYCNCQADRITYSNGVADGIEGNFIEKKNGNVIKYRIRVNAKVIVISAGAIASSQLLLKNAIATKTAGKGLSFHPASFLLGKFEKEINAYDGIPMAYTCHEFGVTNGVKEGGFLIESIFLPIFQFSLGVPSFAEEHQLFMKDYAHYAMAGIMLRDKPVGIVSLTANGNAKVQYDPIYEDMKTFARGLKLLAEMWFDVGAIEVVTGHRDIVRLQNKTDIDRLVHAVEINPDGLTLASAHPQGGNRMGSNSAESVVDSNCQVHGFSNLFVCDASVFPTAVGVNPQITVMALATMTADYITKEWNTKFANILTSPLLGETCSIMQPMYCSVERLETMFSREENRMPVETLINASINYEGELDVGEDVWSFDKKTMIIHNNKHWKGFFPSDQDVATMAMKYFGGFWKRFFIKDGKIKGVTHPYDAPVYAENIPEPVEHNRFGKIIHLRYTGSEYSMFYDLLKIIDNDTILGKAFFGTYPHGNQMLVFSMSRKYGVDFMTEEDHERIFKKHSTSPIAEQVEGRWIGKLVSDSALTPVVQTFTYGKNELGQLQMQYVFGGMMSGISRIVITPEQMYMYDFTNWHDEVKMVTENFMVGKWCSPAMAIPPINFAPSFLSIEDAPNEPNKKRLCLRFILRRN